MYLKDYREKIRKIQNSIYTPIYLNDAVIEIIDITFCSLSSETVCAPHEHVWFEANFIMSGRAYTSFGIDKFEVNKGDYFLVPPFVVHSHEYDSINLYEDICIRWQLRKNESITILTESSTYELLNSLKNWEAHSMKDNYSIKELFIRMLDEADSNFSALNLQLLLLKIITIIAEINMPYRKETGSESNTLQNSIIRKIDILLGDLLTQEINVHSLAASLHMSYGYLARLYKKATGYTIIDRLAKLRVEKAMELLKCSDYSLKEISEKAGFSSQYYFSNSFKRISGLTPSEYKNSSD